MILGMPPHLFYGCVALLLSAAALVCVVVAWYRSVAAVALLGERWVNNCGSLEKAVKLCARYEAATDKRMQDACRRALEAEIAAGDAVGERMLREALGLAANPAPLSRGSDREPHE